MIVKKTKNLGTLVIKRVDKKLAKEIIIKNHYSHKWNAGFGIYSYGIFRQGDSRCLGVAAYGYMKNSKARIFSHPNPKGWMIELNRMWIDDCLGKNAETVLIGASLKLLKKDDPNIVAVQSFADGRLGCGTIYKASNFKYFGFHHTKFLENKRTGEITHEQVFTNTTSKTGYVRANTAYLCGDFKEFRVRTYRYIFPLCRHFKFIKPQKAYPPYNKGSESIEWKRDRAKIKENLHRLIEEI